MQEKQKFNDDLRENFFQVLVLNLFFVGSSIVFLYLIVKDLIKIFS